MRHVISFLQVLLFPLYGEGASAEEFRGHGITPSVTFGREIHVPRIPVPAKGLLNNNLNSSPFATALYWVHGVVPVAMECVR